MDPFKESLAFWSSILGTMIELLGLIESSRWLAVLGLFLLAGSGTALLYARKQRQRLRLAAVKIEGRSIDSLNVASLGRRLNRSLIVQEADQVVTVTGEDTVVTWRYRGYCRAAREAAIEFSIDTDNHVPFDRLECFAYDLQHDPKRMHRIRPLLLGADGLSKKVAVPLLERLSGREPFNVVLTCELPGSMKSGMEYYASTTSVAQDRIPTSTVRLVFLHDRPEWVRVYECGASGATKLLRDLRPSRETAQLIEYTDLATDVPAQCARIYLFRRSADLAQAA
ncbi:MAG: hypothetical protein ABSC23_11715 [Bryobacteraceae bacterium]|jgi:hypothetical protein